MNSKISINNKSGYKGISLGYKGKWIVHWKNKYVGLYDTIEEAIIARQKADELRE